MEDPLNSKYAVRCILLCQATSYIRVGFGLSYLNPALPALTNFINESHIARYGTAATRDHVNLIANFAQCSYDIGAMVGALIVNLILRRFSRRIALVIPHLLWLLSAVLMSPLANAIAMYELVVVGRAISGVSRGLSFIILPLFVAETTCRDRLAFFQGLTVWMFEGGLILGAVAGSPAALGTAARLPYLFALPAVLSVIFVVALPCIPQTVPWLIMRENRDAGKQFATKGSTPLIAIRRASYFLLRSLRDNGDVGKEYCEITEQIASDAAVEHATIWDFIRVPQYRRQLLASTVILAGAQFSTVPFVFYFSAEMFIRVGISPTNAGLFTIGLLCFVFVCTCASLGLISRLGAKKLYLYGGAVILVGGALLVVSSLRYLNLPGAGYLNVAASMLIILGFTGPKQGFAIFPSELTTYVTRPIVLWLSSSLFYASAVVITISTPYMMLVMDGFAYLPWLGIFAAALAYVKWVVPDTHRKSIAEIQAELHGRTDYTSFP